MQETADEGARKGVSGAHGADDLYFRRGLEGASVLPDNPAAVDAFREDDHVQVAGFHEPSAQDLLPGHPVAEEARDDGQLFLVEFQDVCPAEALPDDGFGEVVLTEVDVTDLQAVRRAVVQKGADAPPRFLPPLGQGAEADRLRPRGDFPELVRKGDVAPRTAGVDGVFRVVRVRDVRINRPGRIGNPVQVEGESVPLQLGADAAPVPVDADGAHDEPLMAHLRGVVGEIGRCPAERLTAGELVPEDFADAHDVAVFLSDLIRNGQEVRDVVDDVIGFPKVLPAGIAVGDGAGMGTGPAAHLDIDRHVTHDEGFLSRKSQLPERLQDGLRIGLGLGHVIGPEDVGDVFGDAHIP